MNDATTKSPDPLHSDMQSLYEREARWMAVCARVGREIPSRIERLTESVNARDEDAPKVRLATDRGLNE